MDGRMGGGALVTECAVQCTDTDVEAWGAGRMDSLHVAVDGHSEGG